MLLFNQRTNKHLKLKTQTPTRIIHQVMILVQTFLITFDEMNVSALNEPQNISLATGKENRKPNSRKRKRAVTSEVESMKTKLLTQVYRSFKRGSETPEQNIRPPLVGLLVD